MTFCPESQPMTTPEEDSPWGQNPNFTSFPPTASPASASHQSKPAECHRTKEPADATYQTASGQSADRGGEQRDSEATNRRYPAQKLYFLKL